MLYCDPTLKVAICRNLVHYLELIESAWEYVVGGGPAIDRAHHRRLRLQAPKIIDFELLRGPLSKIRDFIFGLTVLNEKMDFSAYQALLIKSFYLANQFEHVHY